MLVLLCAAALITPGVAGTIAAAAAIFWMLGGNVSRPLTEKERKRLDRDAAAARARIAAARAAKQ